ncbi:Uncharacterised protein [BD1-7 clade bacterium]|uniref:Uncharacterized protein n=1 Tax=BD1-7 clade bacterium TaxID=2029982 RepID=A0A5S9P3N1_9GAMM|nr:Uncharacterised protein [BD1-7 clade bacterium]CAA0097969.1 Uncharacterised protein [BD1-7 clade bacterium]
MMPGNPDIDYKKVGDHLVNQHAQVAEIPPSIVSQQVIPRMEHLFVLEKSGEDYLALPFDGQHFSVSIAQTLREKTLNGIVLFVVRCDNPCQVVCGVPFGNDFYADAPGLTNNIGVHGHSSISYRPPHSVAQTDILASASASAPPPIPKKRKKMVPSPVIYAGEIIFEKNKLVRWTNGSGHYKPASISRHQLTSNVKRLLPEKNFEPWNQKSLIARGYRFLPGNEVEFHG